LTFRQFALDANDWPRERRSVKLAPPLHKEGAVQERHLIDFESPRGVTGVARTDAIVISHVRFLRDCLESALERDPGVRVVQGCATLAEATRAAIGLGPCLMLLDSAFPDGPQVVADLRSALPAVRIVVFALPETEQTILRWARAGIAGYLPASAPLSDLSALLAGITRGEQFCSSRITGALLRRLGDPADASSLASGRRPALTGREQDILELVGLGLTNKEIARRLDIGLGTTKTHVHNLLRKLKLKSRAQVAAQLRAAQMSPSGSLRLKSDIIWPVLRHDLYPGAAPSLSPPISSD
jgi:two-component system, NarL family, nitrate/nitrite response regulator NarL